MSATNIRLEPTETNLDHCARLLQAGELVAVPTETVYGLAGNALDERAVHKIFQVKGRPLIDPLICHFNSIESASAHVRTNEASKLLASQHWPGALTIVLEKQPSIPDLVTAGLNSAAIRVPAHPVLRDLLSRLDFPLAAPSANPFGYVSPTLAEHVQTTLGTRIQAILDAGMCSFGVESTIIDLRRPEHPQLLRHGPIAIEQLSNTLGTEVTDATCAGNDSSSQTAPGLLTQHYSPSAKVVLYEHAHCTQKASTSEAVVLNRKPSESTPEDSHTFWLSENGENSMIAHNLFDLLQKLDQRGYLTIHVELSNGKGIGKAINDRLSRAAAK